MKNLLLTLSLALAAGLWIGCGEGDTSCEASTDCVGTEQCLWVKRSGQVVGKSCVQKCAADTECGGRACNGGATSCPSCNDFFRVCSTD